MNSIGLDYGTTNTRLALSGKPWRQRNTANGLIPSAVAFLPTGQISLGEEAKARLFIDETNVVIGPKRLLGAPFYSRAARQYDAGHSISLIEREDGSVSYSTRVGLKTPEELSGRIIEHIITQAEVDRQNSRLALTVPVAFSEKQRQSLATICGHLGFPQVGLLDEPVATAVAYRSRSNLDRAAVFDLGGGTFDVAIIGHPPNSQGIEVLGTGGDDTLGGDDIDLALATWAAEEMLAKTGWDLKNDKIIFSRVVTEVEKAKRALWNRGEVYLDLSGVDDASPVDLPKLLITRGFLFDLAFPLIQRTFGIIDEVLFEIKMKTKQIDAVFMAGGGTLIHGVAEAVARYFGKPARTDIDPAYVVSIGASLTMARPSLQELLSTYPPPK